jgi:hypothetical protein
MADLPDQAFAAGKASISANFFFLVKYAEVELRSFICKGDEGAGVFKPAKSGISHITLPILAQVRR